MMSSNPALLLSMMAQLLSASAHADTPLCTVGLPPEARDAHAWLGKTNFNRLVCAQSLVDDAEAPAPSLTRVAAQRLGEWLAGELKAEGYHVLPDPSVRVVKVPELPSDAWKALLKLSTCHDYIARVYVPCVTVGENAPLPAIAGARRPKTVKVKIKGKPASKARLETPDAAAAAPVDLPTDASAAPYRGGMVPAR